jgi:uncharacterized integral membrane protein
VASASSLLVAAVTAVFVVQNTDRTAVEFLAWRATVPLAIALLLAVVLGGLIGSLITLTVVRPWRGRGGRDQGVPGVSDPATPG